MNPFPIIRASWRRYPGTALATVLLVALAVALGTAVSLLEPSIRRGATAAADRFDLVVGAPGGEAQLVLSAVYLDGTPLPPLSGAVLDRVRNEAGVAWCSPLLFGDTWRGLPIVGVDEVFLDGQGAFRAPEDAYAGALVPLEPGERFHGAHGAAAVTEHDESHTEYVVKGRLAPTGTPWDRALLVSASSLWRTHGLVAGQSSPPVSAVVVKPRSVADAYRLRQLFRTESSVALFPAEVLVRLYALLGDAQTLFSGMARLAQGAVLAAVLMAVFAGMARRRKTLAVLRALGAPRRYGALTLWLEVFLMLAAGGLVGLVLGWGLCAWGASLAAKATGVALTVTLGKSEWAAFGLTLLVGGAAALLPAWSGYRLSVAAALRE